MRTTINIPEDLIRETEALYNTSNRSKAIESALKDALRIKKLKALQDLKGRLTFDEESIKAVRSSEIEETEYNS